MSETINNQSGSSTTTLNKNSKTNRKNNKNQSVNWPNKDAYFTFSSLAELNRDIIEISLRTKLSSAIEKGTVTHIGDLHNEIGRPKKAFAMSPVTPEFLKNLEQNDQSIVLVSKYQTINLFEVNKKYIPSVNPASPFVRIQSTKQNA